jgi:hypothetical protein
LPDKSEVQGRTPLPPVVPAKNVVMKDLRPSIFQKSEWFRRGWTLQELIAPSVLIFLDKRWNEIGTKLSMCSLVSETTQIPEDILSGADVASKSVAERMSWAAYRRTTKVEDKAVCLMGLFGVNMPLLYGEQDNAFFRLQEEILKL